LVDGGAEKGVAEFDGEDGGFGFALIEAGF
jgi:hypothetical protein